MSTATAEHPPLKIALGAGEAGIFDAGVPVLAGEAVENLFGAARAAGRVGELTLFEVDGWLLGAASLPAGAKLENSSHQIYGSILQAAHGRHLARIWNYVPAINEAGPDGLENYRVFCRGRSLAFEEHYGRGFNTRLSSASAVGCQASALTVAFAACHGQPRHIENPLQVPAYEYPGIYGPRAPSFARATVVPGIRGTTVFISGTAAIRGHATIAPDRVRDQVECTLQNLGAISEACGLGADLDEGGGSTRHFKVYVRHAADQALVAAMLGERLLKDTDRVSYLEAGICRTPLLVEIEASLFQLPPQ